MLRLNPSLFAASVTLSTLSPGRSAKGPITTSLCSATPQGYLARNLPLVCVWIGRVSTAVLHIGSVGQDHADMCLV